jgi:hypothetical protein
VPAVIVGQLQELAVEAPGELAGDVGIEERRAGGKPARGAARAEALQAEAAQLHREVGNHQEHVHGGAGEIEAERPAVQAERADQAEVAIDERRHPRMPFGDVAIDRLRDDRLRLGLPERRDPGVDLSARCRLHPVPQAIAARLPPASTPSTSAAKRG